MPTQTVGYYTACAYCCLRTDIVWGKPIHLCQVCGKPFCKRCGISFVCKSCLAQKPPDVQEGLTKKAKSIPIGTAVGLLSWFGGPLLLIFVLMSFVDFFKGENAIWMMVFLIGGILFLCCFGLKSMWGGYEKMMRLVNQTYFGKDSKKYNFSGLTKMGGFQQVPANPEPSVNFTPASFNTQPNTQPFLFDVPSSPAPSSTPTEFQFCPLCGGQVRATICQNCGSKICPKCRHPDPDKSARFCGNCGNVF